MIFTCPAFNSGRRFHAEDFNAAAARVADRLAFLSGGRRACAWTLRQESVSPDRSRREYSSTAGIPEKQGHGCRVIGDSRFSITSVK